MAFESQTNHFQDNVGKDSWLKCGLVVHWFEQAKTRAVYYAGLFQFKIFLNETQPLSANRHRRNDSDVRYCTTVCNRSRSALHIGNEANERYTCLKAKL